MINLIKNLNANVNTKLNYFLDVIQLFEKHLNIFLNDIC